MRLAPWASVVLLMLAALWPATAAADFDLDRAGQDARSYPASGHAGFCSRPSPFMDPDAERLCPLSDVKGCEGFAKVCAQSHGGGSAREPKEQDSPQTPAFLGAVAHVLLWVLILGVVALVLGLIVQALRRAREDRKLADVRPAEPTITHARAPEPDALPPITDAELLLRKAAELDRSGNHEGALFTYLEASLRALDQRGSIRITRDRTHGEYVRGCKEPQARAPLGEIVREVDRVKFGGADATPEASGRAAERASMLVRAAVVAMGLMLALTGCGKGVTSHKTADDPAGTDVLVDLLERQGMHAGPLRGSLARLPMPGEGSGETPAVMVDMDRTKIDEGTSHHLMEWVRAGGSLVLVGRPSSWPQELTAHAVPSSSTLVTATVGDGEDEYGRPIVKKYAGKLAGPAAIEMKCDLADPQPLRANTLVWAGEPSAAAFASFCFVGDGIVIGVASDDVFTNVGMIQPGNAELAFAILSRLPAHQLFIAEPMDGIEPPASPITSINRAGLGLGLWHALAATAILFWAIGWRLTRAIPTPPPARRAFTEHVEATGLVYARAKAATHALRAFARFADERLRAMMPRGVSDPAAFMALRSGVAPEECDRLWKRATSASPKVPPAGDELEVLKRLTSLYTVAARRS